MKNAARSLAFFLVWCVWAPLSFVVAIAGFAQIVGRELDPGWEPWLNILPGEIK